MHLLHIRGAWLPLRVIASLFYRKVELRFLCKVANKRWEEVDLLTHMVGMAFRSKTPSLTGVRCFTLNDMGHAVDANGKQIDSLCWNVPIAITIYLDGNPYIGLGVELRGRALCIRQMQGVAGVRFPKAIQDWPELLVKACITHAESIGLSEVRIYKANQDFGFEYPTIELQEGQKWDDVVKAHQDRLRRRYDRVAQSLKFKKKKRYYVWEIPPETQPQ